MKYPMLLASAATLAFGAAVTLACDEDTCTTTTKTTKTIQLSHNGDDVSISGTIVISLGDGTTKVIELGDQNVAVITPDSVAHGNEITFGPSGLRATKHGNTFMFKGADVAPNAELRFGTVCPEACCPEGDARAKSGQRGNVMYFGPGDGPKIRHELRIPDITIPEIRIPDITLPDLDALQLKLRKGRPGADGTQLHQFFDKKLHEHLTKNLHEQLHRKLDAHRFALKGEHLDKLKQQMKDHGVDFDFEFDGADAFDLHFDGDAIEETIREQLHQHLKDHNVRFFSDSDGAHTFSFDRRFGADGTSRGFSFKMHDDSENGAVGEVIIVTPDGTQRFELDGDDLPDAARKVLEKFTGESGNTFENWSKSHAEPNDDGVEVIELPLERRSKDDAARKKDDAKAKKAEAKARKADAKAQQAEADLAERLTKLKKELAELEAQLKNLRERANPKR